MHETGRAQSILRAVLEKAQKENIPIVKRVEVLVSPIAGVDKEELSEIIEELKRNTFLGETHFELKETELQAICKNCGMRFPISSPSDTCPNCQSGDVELSLINEWEIGNME